MEKTVLIKPAAETVKREFSKEHQALRLEFIKAAMQGIIGNPATHMAVTVEKLRDGVATLSVVIGEATLAEALKPHAQETH